MRTIAVRTAWSPAFAQALVDDLDTLAGSDPLTPEQNTALWLTWAALIEVDRHLQGVVSRHHDGEFLIDEIRAARHAAARLNRADLDLSPACAEWLRHQQVVEHPYIDWEAL